jgi:hypothetical protein
LEVKTEKERKERIKEEGAEHRNREGGGREQKLQEEEIPKKKTHNREGAEPPSNSLEPAAPPR